jgi:D-amino peptidase
METVMRKLFLSVDIEGVSAVASRDALAPGRWEWEAARNWMTDEAIAAAEAALESGYDEVILTDGHGNASNIHPDRLPDNVRLLRSWPRPLLQMEGVDYDGVEACAFVGYHAAAGTPDSVLAHTYSGLSFREIRFNGVVCSEGYLNAALAGELGRPVILVSGDEQTVEDARRYAPDATMFVAKQSVTDRASSSLPPAQVCRGLKAAMAEAVSKPLPAPFVVAPPYRLELVMTTQSGASMLSWLPGVERTDGWTIAVNLPSVRDAMRFISCATLYTPSGIPALS